MDERLLAVDRHALRMGVGQLDFASAHDRGLDGRSLGTPTRRLDLDRRSLAVNEFIEQIDLPVRESICSTLGWGKIGGAPLYYRHSLGSAVALDFTARNHVQRVVAISAFTSLREQAARLVGIPCELRSSTALRRGHSGMDGTRVGTTKSFIG